MGGPGGPGGGLPIKGFVGPRAKSVNDQLAGKSQGQAAGGPGFGPGRGGPGGPGGPSMFLAPGLTTAMDLDRDGTITREEFTGAFAKWFKAWSGGSDEVTVDQLSAGLNEAFRPPMP
jgi:hypothetical protein